MMLAFAHTMLAPVMALALAYVGFLVVMGLRAATLRDVLLVRLPCRWMHAKWRQGGAAKCDTTGPG